MRPVLALLCAAGCSVELAHEDSAYARHDGERVLCGVGIDGDALALGDIERGLQRARSAGEVLILFAHDPGRTVTHERLDAILGLAAAADVPLLTFPELATEAPTAGLAFGFDDAYVEAWFALRDVFTAHRARVTFFVSNYGALDERERDMLHQLASDGHAIEAHGMGHRDAPIYVERYGLGAYLRDEIDPLLEAMRADGFAPTTFAYPYGARTSAIDAALLERFALIRSLTYLDRGPTNAAPCPR